MTYKPTPKLQFRAIQRRYTHDIGRATSPDVCDLRGLAVRLLESRISCHLPRSRANFFGSFRSDRSWERLHEENRDCRSEQAVRPSLDTTGHDSDESGRDERSACHPASYVSYAAENLLPIPISDEREASLEMAIDPALQQQSIPA